MSGWRILRVLLPRLDWRPRPFLWTWGVAALEVYGRYLGRRDYKMRRNGHVWEIATTTKDLTSGIHRQSASGTTEGSA